MKKKKAEFSPKMEFKLPKKKILRLKSLPKTKKKWNFRQILFQIHQKKSKEKILKNPKLPKNLRKKEKVEKTSKMISKIFQKFP